MMLRFLLSGSLRQARTGGKGMAAYSMVQFSLVLTQRSYKHVVSGEQRDGDLPLLRGGILADVSRPFHVWGALVLTLSRRWALGRQCRP